MSARSDGSGLRVAGASSRSGADKGRTRARLLRRLLQGSAVVLAVLLAVGTWAAHAMRESLDEAITSDLSTVLDASIQGLDIWRAKERALVASWVPHVRAQVLDVAARSAGAQEAARAPGFPALQRKLTELARLGEHPGAMLLSTSGRILGATQAAWVGSDVPASGLKRLAPALQGQSMVSRPFRIPMDDGVDSEPATLMVVAVPVMDDQGRVAAVLGALINPDVGFTRILSTARIGETGETYAFDRTGLMLSGSRFEDNLMRLGLIPESDDPTSVLNLHLKDPGGNLLTGHAVEDARDALPLTRMAASAVTGASGIDVRGYRDYLGETVVGAWAWLPEMHMGVATEVNQREVYRAMRPALLAFAGLFALVSAACVAAVFFSYRAAQLSSRVARLERLGQYTLEQKIGEGGMGEVYRARHAMLQRPTAVKLLKPEVMTEDMVARFEREVQLTSRLGHPNTIEVYDYGRTPEGLFYYAMEYLDGVSLADLLADAGAMPVARSVHVLMHVCLSLEEAHSIGLVHRDIKPANIMLCVRGLDTDVVKVLDFGLVRDASGEDIRLTRHQEVPGTPLYIAPERLRDPTSADPRTDIYSLGVVAFGMLTGTELFSGDSSTQIVYQAISTPAPRIGEAAGFCVPAELEELVARCLEKDPAARPASVREMIDVLSLLAETHPWTRDDARAWWDGYGKRYRDGATDVASPA